MTQSVGGSSGGNTQRSGGHASRDGTSRALPFALEQLQENV
jgi:hypothetical protein